MLGILQDLANKLLGIKSGIRMNHKLNTIYFKDGEDLYVSLKIFDLCTYIRRFEPSLVRDVSKFKITYMSLLNSIWKASIVFDKIEFSRHLFNRKQIVDMQHAGFVRTDIEHFHIIVRSSMDYVIEILANLLNFKIQNSSFSRFRNTIHEKEDVLGQDISDLIKNTEWYSKLTKVRNKLIHSGAETPVYFNEGNGTVFEIDLNEGVKGEMHIFEEYAVEYYSEYLYFLDKIGELLIDKLVLKSLPPKFRISGQGIKVLSHWANSQSFYA
tara:strand:- start:20751 stop:21557 length:807 start_codon:yes stop_codon:yes gene_type:complete